MTGIQLVTCGKKITVYTDGSCRISGRNGRGRGGWAYSISVEGRELRHREAVCPDAASWEMEIMAVIKALELLIPCSPESILVCTDYADIPRFMDGRLILSEIDCRARLFDELLWTSRFLSCPVLWRWVKGHSGKRFNELCDMRLRNMLGIKRRR